MSRMPMHVLYSFRYAFRASVFAVAIAIFSLFSSTAHADPHAVFYTDRAQEQLFFNTLAALNQADFVEPGRADGTGRTRQEILSNRDSVPLGPGQTPIEPFTPSQVEIITSTHTDLPAVLSRSVTLEGDDLWTAYLVHQFALETRTRKSESRLSRILCQYAFGDPGCNQSSGKDHLAEKAYTTIPINEIGAIDVASSATLGSGDPIETALRNTIQQKDPKKINENPALYSIPRPYSPTLAGLRNELVKENDKNAQNYVNSLTASISSAGNAIDPTMFSDVTFEEGVPTLEDTVPAETYVGKLVSLLNLPSALSSIAKSGEQQAQLF